MANMGGWEASPQGPLLSYSLHRGIHDASEASTVLKQGGMECTIWVQVQGLQNTTADRRHLPVDQREESNLA